MSDEPETVADFFEVLTAQNAAARDSFLSNFETVVRSIAVAAAETLPALEAFPEGLPTDARTLWVHRFLMGAFDCAVSSTGVRDAWEARLCRGRSFLSHGSPCELALMLPRYTTWKLSIIPASSCSRLWQWRR
jgi:hypothetical protein